MAPVLGVRDLNVRFATPEGTVAAVSDLDFDIAPGETLAVVGESGSGKSQTFLAIMGLLARNGRASGQAMLDGRNLIGLPQRALDQYRGARLAMVFQDPMTALNPVLRLSRQLVEPLDVHRGLSPRAAAREAIAMLERVGVPDAPQRFHRYPHELSGGLRQRVMIAMALLCRPALLVADEPTTALDVTIQAQVLELFAGLKAEFGMALVLITHDLGVVAGLADRVMVMYAGRAVEVAPVDALFAAPAHPYTQALLAATPDPARGLGALRPISGAPPNLQHLPPGCAFAPRCARASEACATRPPLEAIGSWHSVACHHPGARP